MYYAQAVTKNTIDTASIVPHFEQLAAQYPNSGIRRFHCDNCCSDGEEFTRASISVRGAGRAFFRLHSIPEARALYSDLRACLRRGLSGEELVFAMYRIGGRRP